jgi:DNA-directed RNA polymerase subunit alpha
MDTELLEFRIEQGFSSHSPNSQNSLKTTAAGRGTPAPGTLSPPAITLLKENNCSHYGKFYFSGLKKGQGITVANALRRVLLYDLFGIGLTKAKFQLRNSKSENVSGDSAAICTTPKLHEFSTVSGMKESVLELLIHLRSIIWVKPLDSFSLFRGKLTLHNVINLAGVAPLIHNNQSTDGMFILQAKHLLWGTKSQPGETGVSPLAVPLIVNPDQYLATFVPIQTKPGGGYSSSCFPNFEMDFELQAGNLDVQTDVLPNEFLVESGPFFPIQKVNYTVELEKNSTKSLKTGQSSSTECVFFEIWTDGSLHPQKALSEAFLILHNLFEPGFPPPS